eukprot:10145202-Heterocapsa_arctica.AAC.1
MYAAPPPLESIKWLLSLAASAPHLVGTRKELKVSSVDDSTGRTSILPVARTFSLSSRAKISRPESAVVYFVGCAALERPPANGKTFTRMFFVN